MIELSMCNGICRFSWFDKAYHLCLMEKHEGPHVCRCGAEHCAGLQSEFPVDLNMSGLIT